MHLNETVLCTTAPLTSSSTPGIGTISLHDIQTGSTLASFKQTSADRHSTAIIPTRNGQGGLICAAQSEKSILHVYNFQKDQISLKIVLPEKLSCIAVEPRGNFCAGGTAHGRIYLWEIASGIMFNSWEAHYRRINVLRFSQDSAVLLSGSEDSGVSVWSVSRLLDNELQNEAPTPYCMLVDHTLPVTDLICGVGLFPACRVFTCSIDHTVKIWDLFSKSLLTTFHFPQPISSLALDQTERTFFAASEDGSIHQVNLFRRQDNKAGHRVMEAVGGAGLGDIIRIEPENDESSKKRLIVVGHPITTMTISLTASMLLVGTATGLIHIYDIASHQLLRSISSHKGLKLTHLETMLRPPDLIGHLSLSLNVMSASDAKDVMPVHPIAPFQKMRDVKARQAHEVPMLLPVQKTQSFRDDPSTYSREEALRDGAFFTAPSSSAQSMQSRVAELESEVAWLREQLGKAKGVNDVMWETVVQQVVAQAKDVNVNGCGPPDGVVPMEDAEGRRKRGRV